MRSTRALLSLVFFTISIAALGADPRIAIYNQNFAVVRQTVPLSFVRGVNNIRITDVTAHLEPDSVILRDPAGKQAIQILEQNYRADPVSQDLLLSVFEGKVIDFLVQTRYGHPPSFASWMGVHFPVPASMRISIAEAEGAAGSSGPDRR
jgi:hypothetical protein